MLQYKDRVQETTSSTGTGSLTLAGALSGYQSFSSALNSGDTCYYAISDIPNNAWEVGLGTFTSPSTLARTTILASSNGGSVVTLAAGTKQVFITVPAAALPLYNVKAFGAKCDGSTDDTTAIQAALDAAAAAGMGTVLVPASAVVTNITIDSYVELVGASTGVTLLSKSGATGYMIALKTPSTTQRIAIRNISIKPNRTGLGGINLDNTGFGSSTDPLHELENVIVTNSVNDAFHFDNAQRELRVRDCKAYFTTTGYGFYVGAGCTDSRFSDCTAGTSASNGWEIVGNNNSFSGCKAFWSGYNGSTWGTTQVGFHLNATDYSTFVNCSAQQAALHGWNIVSCSRTSVVACESDSNSAGASVTTGVGFNLDSNTFCSINDNTGGNNGILSPGSQKYGIQVTGTQTGVIIMGNTVTGSSGDFGYVSGFGYILISGTVVDFTGIPFKFGAGTAATEMVAFVAGTNLTTPVAGAVEYDGNNLMFTPDTSHGRALVPTEQKFRLTATGATISTIANYFGASSNITLVSGAEYEIEIDCWFLKNTAGVVTWTFTNSAAPASMSIEYKLSPAAGIVSTPAATALFGEQYNVTAAAPTVVSASLTTAVNHHHKFLIRLINGTGTSLKIQATCGAGSITPGINSSWKARRIPAANIGTFAA